MQNSIEKSATFYGSLNNNYYSLLKLNLILES